VGRNQGKEGRERRSRVPRGCGGKGGRSGGGNFSLRQEKKIRNSSHDRVQDSLGGGVVSASRIMRKKKRIIAWRSLAGPGGQGGEAYLRLATDLNLKKGEKENFRESGRRSACPRRDEGKVDRACFGHR